MNGSLEIVFPLPQSLHQSYELPIIRVMDLLPGECLHKQKLIGLLICKLSYWSRILAIAKSLAFGWRMIGFAGAKCRWISTSVNDFWSNPNASPAIQVHPHLLVAFFIQLQITLITLAYLGMNHWWKFVKPRSTCTYWIDIGVGQFSMVVMQLNLI